MRIRDWSSDVCSSDLPYETLVRRELFEPLGMDRCQVGAWDRVAVGNVAQPHARRDGENVVTGADGALIPNVPMMAAGGIRCSRPEERRVGKECVRQCSARC